MAKDKKKEDKGGSVSVVGADTTGFGGPKNYKINQTPGTENKAPSSGCGH